MAQATGGAQRTLVLAVLVVGGYAAGSLLAWRLLDAGAAPVFFPPAGVTLAALLVSPRARWPWLLLAAGATEVGLDLLHGEVLGAAIGFAAANTVEPWLGATLVRRRVDQPVDVSRFEHAGELLVWAVLVAPLVGAAIGATTDVGSRGPTWLTSFSGFWIGDALGVFTVGGMLLAWSSTLARDRAGSLPAAVWWSAILSLAAAAATYAGFAWTNGPFVLATAVLLVAATLGMTPLLTVSTVLVITANALSAARIGPWRDVAITDHRAWLGLQFSLAVSLVGGAALGIGLAQRDRARRVRDVEMRSRERVELLHEVTSRLSTAITPGDVAAAVAEHGVSRVAEIGSVGVLSPDGRTVTNVPSRALPPEIAERYASLPVTAPYPVCVAIRSGAPVITQRASESARRFPASARNYAQLGIHGVLAVPIVVDGLPVGSLSFGFAEPDVVTPELVARAEELAAETAPALGRARRHEQDRVVAHQLQVSLLPQVDPAPAAGVTVAALYQPADPDHEVGGDWYDVFALPGGRVAIAVGDVVGHDLAAATTMGRLQSLLRVMVHEEPDPASALTRLDRAVHHVGDARMTTAGVAVWDPRGRTLRYSCAGHPAPVLLTATGADPLEHGRGLPLGVDGTLPRDCGEVRITAPAQLLWYTDGLIEQPGQPLSLGLDRLLRVVRRQDPTASSADVSASVMAQLTADRRLADDVVLVCVRFGSDPADPAS